jgi:hypothetical protein
MANTSEIQALVESFVAQLTEAIQQHTLATIHDALGGAAAPAKGQSGRASKRGPSSRAPRAKGAKRSPEELEQLTAQLAKYVKGNPGQGIEAIAAGMGVSTKELALPAKKLLADKVLKTKGQKRATKYFPG